LLNTGDFEVSKFADGTDRYSVHTNKQSSQVGRHVFSTLIEAARKLEYEVYEIESNFGQLQVYFRKECKND